jgi:hypothetical protein
MGCDVHSSIVALRHCKMDFNAALDVLMSGEIEGMLQVERREAASNYVAATSRSVVGKRLL